MEHRPDHGSHRLESLLTGAPVPVTRGALHAKGGYQVLCVSSNLAFTNTIAHLALSNDAHPAIAWSIEDLERLPFWSFHGVVIDSEAWNEIESRASPRIRTLLARRPVVVASRGDAEQAIKSLIADMAAAHAGPLTQP